jgi:predicted RNA-binding Zn-ribbon protein involved in translation (DUF1610 family)
VPFNYCPSCGNPLGETRGPLSICPFCGGSLAPPPRAFDPHTGVNLLVVAKRQRLLIWYVLALLIIQILPAFTTNLPSSPLLDVGIVLFVWGMLILIVIGVVRLHRAMGTSVLMCVIGALMMLIPIVSLIFLLIANRRATRLLRNAGLKVGLMGVQDKDALRRLSLHLCRTCGYDLTGNVSGRCPECGTEIVIVAQE